MTYCRTIQIPAGTLLVLTDARGEILWRVGSPDVLRRADRLGMLVHR